MAKTQMEMAYQELHYGVQFLTCLETNLFFEYGNSDSNLTRMSHRLKSQKTRARPNKKFLRSLESKVGETQTTISTRNTETSRWLNINLVSRRFSQFRLHTLSL
jgi:hypothetical protein